MHQIIIQHFPANLKRVFCEIIVSSRNSVSYRFYGCLNIVHYRFTANCTCSSPHFIPQFFLPKSLVNNDINALLGKPECDIP